MNDTTLIKKRNDMPRRPLENCHGGMGALDWIGVLDSQDLGGRLINFIHDDILPPGASIGRHEHTEDEEYYYVLTGRGIMILDGTPFEVSAGDITAVFPGGNHSLENTGHEDLRIIVLSVKGRQPDKPDANNASGCA